jgi:hypothetical protein
MVKVNVPAGVPPPPPPQAVSESATDINSALRINFGRLNLILKFLIKLNDLNVFPSGARLATTGMV